MNNIKSTTTTSSSIKICVESFGDEAGYVAWIDNEKFKGMVVQASTKQKAFKELLISLNAKFAYDYGIAISGVDEKIKEMMDNISQNCDGQNEINLKFA